MIVLRHSCKKSSYHCGVRQTIIILIWYSDKFDFFSKCSRAHFRLHADKKCTDTTKVFRLDLPPPRISPLIVCALYSLLALISQYSETSGADASLRSAASWAFALASLSMRLPRSKHPCSHISRRHIPPPKHGVLTPFRSDASFFFAFAILSAASALPLSSFAIFSAFFCGGGARQYTSLRLRIVCLTHSLVCDLLCFLLH